MNDPDPDPDFQLEEELLEAVPRRVVATKGALLAWRVGWNLLLAIVCLVYLLGSNEINDLKNLSAHGRVINGYVVTPTNLPADSHRNSCMVAYTLNRDSTEADSTFELSGCAGPGPQAGEAFLVTCLPRTPWIYRLGTIGPSELAECRSHWIAVGLWWVVPYLFVMWFVKCYEETRKQLLRNGMAVVATVNSRRETKGEDSTFYTLNYGFSLPDGRHRTNEIPVSKVLYDACPEGRKFSVLVADNDTYSSTPYFSITGALIRNAPKRSFL